MPLKDNFIFKEVAKEYMMVPLLNGNVNMSKVINLNETGAFIIKKLKEKDSIDYLRRLDGARILQQGNRFSGPGREGSNPGRVQPHSNASRRHQGGEDGLGNG